MQPFIDRIANPLQREVLAATIEIQRTDRRIAIVRAQEKRPERLPASGQRDGFGFIPAGAESADQSRKISRDYKIDRIALAHSRSIGSRPRRLDDVLTKLRNVALDELARRIKVRKI